MSNILHYREFLQTHCKLGIKEYVIVYLFMILHYLLVKPSAASLVVLIAVIVIIYIIIIANGMNKLRFE